MKKLLILAAGLAAMLSFTACDKPEEEKETVWVSLWVVENDTSNDIIFKESNSSRGTFIIAPGVKATLNSKSNITLPSNELPDFYTFIENATISEAVIFDSDENWLKVWNSSDKESTGKQFYNDKYWSSSVTDLDEQGSDLKRYIWHFIIEESDIVE